MKATAPRHDDSSGRSTTLVDVGVLAGVSPNTVSLSMRDDPRVRSITKQRVLAAAESLGYRANAAARALATNYVPYVGVISACSASGTLAMTAEGLLRCQAPLITALTKQFADCGFHLVLASENPYISTPATGASMKLPKLLSQHHVSGLVVLNHIWPGLYQAVSRWNVPCVAVAEPSLGIPVVYIDHAHGAKAAVQYLVESGHKRIACLPGSKGSAEVAAKSAMKAMGYLSAMNKAGLSPVPGWDEQVDGAHVNGVTTLLPALLDREPDLTALLVYDEFVATHAIEYLRDRGLRVPRDLSVIALEDDNLGDVFRPTITCVGGPWQDMANIAVQTLIKQIERKPLSQPLEPVRPRLVIRDSTIRRPDAAT